MGTCGGGKGRVKPALKAERGARGTGAEEPLGPREPFLPGAPRPPLGPGSPLGPAVPVGPGSPLLPLRPCSPLSPCLPAIPRAPRCRVPLGHPLCCPHFHGGFFLTLSLTSCFE
uniref:Uncharacterized protein n=1 Tax=Malurus cyaneus samueli TaxID=2593467 RepID=A0A8C5X699_9PASS